MKNWAIKPTVVEVFLFGIFIGFMLGRILKELA